MEKTNVAVLLLEICGVVDFLWKANFDGEFVDLEGKLVTVLELKRKNYSLLWNRISFS